MNAYPTLVNDRDHIDRVKSTLNQWALLPADALDTLIYSYAA